MAQKKSKSSRWIKHISDAELYGNNLSEHSLELFRALYEKLKTEIKTTPFISSKKRCLELLNRIEALLSQYNKELKKYYEDEMLKISDKESKWIVEFLKDFGIAAVIPTTLFKNIKFTPIADQENYSVVVDTLTNDINKKLSSSVKTAYMMKTPTSTTVENLSSKANTIENNIVKESQTINTSAFRITDYLIYKANKTEVIYDAILDTRTCPECSSLHGKTFLASEAPILPKHVNCRCSLMPKDVMEDGVFLSYNEWFEEQSEEDKKNILGKSRYELYKNGIPISRFFNNGKKITLKELFYELKINNEKNM